MTRKNGGGAKLIQQLLRDVIRGDILRATWVVVGDFATLLSSLDKSIR